MNEPVLPQPHELIAPATLYAALNKLHAALGVGCLFVAPDGQVVETALGPRQSRVHFLHTDASVAGEPLSEQDLSQIFYREKALLFTTANGYNRAGVAIRRQQTLLGTVLTTPFLIHGQGDPLPRVPGSFSDVIHAGFIDSSVNYPVLSEEKFPLILSHLDLFAQLITEMIRHKQTEQELNQQRKEEEIHYRTLADNLPQIIYEVNQERKITFINQSVQEILGYTPEEMTDSEQNIFHFIAAQDHEKLKNRVSRILEGEKLEPEEYTMVRKDGTTFPGIILSRPIIVHEALVGLRGVIIDITERKRAERALRESEFKFRSFFNTNPEGILLMNLEGFFMDANRSFLTQSGYQIADIHDHHYRELLPASDHEAAGMIFLRLQSGLSQIEPLQTSYRCATGEYLPISLNSWLVVNEDSVPLYIGLFIHDLRKEIELAADKASLEKQVMQAQKSEAIGTLAGGIAHDFNNILGGIIGYTELALHSGGLAPESRTHSYLERVLASGNRARELVQQILRFSRHGTVPMAPMNLLPVVKESISLLRSTLPSTIEIKTYIDIEEDQILGDPTQMHQVVMNLGTNAFHAMRHNGGLLHIALTTEVLQTAKEWMSLTIPPGKYLCLVVCDNGNGIPPHVVDRIFEPYFTTKKVNEGTGLGLAVTRGIIKNHKGLIEVDTEENQGTCIRIYLPVCEHNGSVQVEEQQALPLGQGQHILIVDDEAFFLEVIEESLRLLGYEVTACRSSQKALLTMQRQPKNYDLVITDQTMPELTGAQLAQKIRQLHASIPIILCTGYSETVTEQSAHYYGITSFLMKPININDLATAVAKVLHPNNSPL